MTVAPKLNPKGLKVRHIDCSTLKPKCHYPIKARGMCEGHYCRWKRRFDRYYEDLLLSPNRKEHFPTQQDVEHEAARLAYLYMNWRPINEHLSRTCEEVGCKKKHFSGGMCQMHYRQVQRHGVTRT